MSRGGGGGTVPEPAGLMSFREEFKQSMAGVRNITCAGQPQWWGVRSPYILEGLWDNYYLTCKIETDVSRLFPIMRRMHEHKEKDMPCLKANKNKLSI